MNKMINIAMKICMYRNYCIFDMTSKKLVQNKNSENIPKYKTSKSNLYRTSREKRPNMKYTIIKIINILQFYIITKKGVHKFIGGWCFENECGRGGGGFVK